MAEEAASGTSSLEALRPEVDVTRRDVPGWLLALIAATLAVGLFLLLESRRAAREAPVQDRSYAGALADAPPPLAIPPVVVPPAPLTARPEPTQIVRVPLAPQRDVYRPIYSQPSPSTFRPIQRPADDVYAPPRYHGLPTDSPPASGGSASGNAMVVDLTAGKGASVNGGQDGAAAADDDTVRATVIRNRASVVQQGVIIAAVLETPLNSDRPGMARAVVSQDVRSFDGSRVLIPRGSRLIGEFKADAGSGLRRILVTWGRLIRPDGVAIRIGSPAADALGGAGIPGRVNTHFLERFSGAVLQSALLVGVNVASQLPRNGSNIYVGVPTQVSQIGQDLVPDTKRPPTVKVKAGAEIAIFVAHDLDFGGTPAVR